LSPEKPMSESKAEEGPPPPPPDESEPGPKTPGEPSYSVEDDAWAENYEEHIDGEEPPPAKPKKRRRYGGTIVLVVIIIALILWTVLSPKVLPQSGDTYLRSDSYASLGGFAGDVDTWAGNATWALSVGGPNSTVVGSKVDLSVLVTKVSEKTSNFWSRGTGIALRNVSLYTEDGAFLAEMKNRSDIGFGPLATVPVSFSHSGDYELYVYVKFIVYADMRIGFLPMKAVAMESEHFTIHVA
jgi:hypothetical protein